MSVSASQLIEALDNAGFEWRPYSGRCMYGKQCVGVALDSTKELWGMAVELGLQGHEFDAPTTDSLGLGIIAYWPRALLTAEQVAEYHHDRDVSDDDESSE